MLSIVMNNHHSKSGGMLSEYTSFRMWGILLSIYETEATYIKIRDKWWGLPLFLPSLSCPFSPTLILSRIFLPVRFSLLSASGSDDQHDDVFQLGGLPGIALGIFVRKYAELGFYERSH